MKILKIEIENFKAFTKNTFDFKNKTHIIAKNGVGKTTIIDAILWALTGKLSNGSTKGFIPRIKDGNSEKLGEQDLAVKTMVKLDFEHNNLNYTIIREFAHNSKNVGGSTISFGTTDNIHITPPKFLEQSFQAIGLNIDTLLFLSNPDILFQTGYNQNDLRKSFFDLTFQQIQKELPPIPETLKNISLFNFTKEIDSVSEKIKSLQATKEAKIDFLRNNENVKEDIGFLNKEISRLSIIEKNNKALIATANDTLNSLQIDFATNENVFKREQSTIQNLIQQEAKLKNQIIQAEQRLKDFVIDENKIKQQTIEIVKKLEQQIKNKQAKVLNEVKQEQRCKTCGQIIKSLQEQLNSKSEKLETWDGTIAKQKLDETFNLLLEQQKREKSLLEGQLENAKKALSELLIANKVNRTSLVAPDSKRFEEQKNAMIERIKELEVKNAEVFNTMTEHRLKSEKVMMLVKTNEDLLTLEKEIKTAIDLKNIVQDYFGNAINFITNFFNKQLKNVSIKIFEYTKTTNTLKEVFKIQEKRNYANSDEMNNGMKLRAGVEILLLLQKSQNVELPIFLDEASRLDDIEFLKSIPNQVIVLETNRTLTNDALEIKELK